MEIKVPDQPPKGFSAEGLTYDITVPIVTLGGTPALYYRCKADAPEEIKVKRAVCDVVYHRVDPETGESKDVVIGKAYFVEGDAKYRVILPKYIWAYSGWPEDETHPLDGDWATAKWVVVDHGL